VTLAVCTAEAWCRQALQGTCHGIVQLPATPNHWMPYSTASDMYQAVMTLSLTRCAARSGCVL